MKRPQFSILWLVALILGTCLSSASSTLTGFASSTPNGWDCSSGDGAAGCLSFSLPSMPTPRSYPAVVAGRDGTIYVIGGYDNSGQPASNAEVYDPGSNSWTKLTPMPTPRYFLAAAAGSDGTIYAIGGYNNSGYLSTVEAYHPASKTWTAVASMSTPRYGPAAVAGSDGKIYALGGYNGSSGYLGTAEAYDPTAGTWSAVASMSTPRYLLAAVAGSDGTLYAIGGYSYCNAFASCAVPMEIYNIAGKSWSSGSALPTPRYGLGAAVGSDGKIYTLGGVVTCGYGCGYQTANNEAYDPGSKTWACTRGTTSYDPCSLIFLAPVPSGGYSIGAATGSDGRIYTVQPSGTMEAYTIPSGSTWPTAPQSLSATPGDTQVTLQWNLPASDGGAAIDRFDISASDGAPADTVTTTVPIAQTSSFTTTVTGLHNGTTYTFSVMAHNANGDGPAGTYLTTPYSLPGKPTSLAATPGNRLVTLSWTPPSDNGTPITDYTITITPANGQPYTQHTYYNTTAATVYSLSNGSTYTFTVAASNIIGTGPASDSATATLPPSVPNTPYYVTATPGDGQATVNWYWQYWDANANGGEPLDRFDVTASDGVDADTVTASVPVTDQNQYPYSTTLTGLHNATAYTISVTAHNSVGSSAPTTTYVTPNQLPGKPANLTVTPGDGQASLTWTAPSDGGPIDYYYMHVLNTQNGYGYDVYAGNATAGTVYGLTNGVAYTFTVRAYNNTGPGPDSDPVSITLAQTAPHAPRYVSATPGDGTVTVNWYVPDSNGGSSIDRYDITASDGVDPDVTASVQVTDQYQYTYSTQLTSLRNAATYTISVTAHNAIGSSVPATTTVTPNQLPGKSLNLTVTPGNGQATASWTAPADGGPVNYYILTYSQGPNTYAYSFSGTSGTLGGLTNGLDYTFKVHAVNDIGAGPDSDPVTITLGQTAPHEPRSLSAKPGDGQAALTWYVPDSNGGSPIDRYDISASDGVNAAVTATVTVTDQSQSTFSTTLTSLHNGATYTISVAAHNSVGSSAPVTTTVTPNQLPGKPLNLTVNPGNGQAAVSWTAPADGGPIGHYVIHYTDGVNAGNLDTGTATSGTVNGLTNNVRYTFTVRAINDTGTGPSTDPVTITLAQTAPDAPRNLSAAPGDGQAALSWYIPDSNGGSTIDRYDISASDRVNAPVTAMVTVTDQSKTSFSTTLTGLHGGTTYTVSVTAHNANGSGPAAKSSVTTSGSSSGPNQPPTVNAGGGYGGIATDPIALDKATASDSDGDPLTYHWTYSVTTGPSDASCAFDNSATLTPNLVCNEAGTYSVTLAVGDGTSTVQDSATVTVISKLIITTASPLPSGSLGVYYNTTLEATGGTPPYTWSIDSGTLPTGLTLDPDKGVISGTPSEAGSFGFVVKVTDKGGQTATGQFTLAPPAPDGDAATSYDVPVSLPGTGDYTLTAGDLPVGLTLDATTGDISGTPTNGGTYTFTISRQGGSVQFTITINNPVPTLSSLNPSSATVGGGGLTLTVNGSKFVRSSSVQWNGSNRPTTYVSATQLTATIAAADVAAAGTPSITVVNPNPGGGTSKALSFTINGRSTGTGVTCTPNQLPTSGSTTCTATVQDTNTGTATAPGGTVNFSANGGGSFGSSSCSPAAGNTSSASCAVTYSPTATGQQTITATFTATDSLHAGSSSTTSITALNSPPVFGPSPGDQTVEYSDYLSFTISASDPDKDSLSFSQSGLPNGLTLTDSHNGTSTISGYPQVAAGTSAVTFTVDDGHGNTATQTLNIVATKEAVVVSPSSSNPTAVKVVTAGGSAPSTTFTATVAEAADDGSTVSAANDGDTTRAQPVTFTLAPVGPGSTYTCTAPSANGTVTGGGRSLSLTAGCTFPAGVAVNVYDLIISVGGSYYQGSAQSVVTVYDPSLGFATGGGWFIDSNGYPVNFGFNAKYVSSGNLQGRVLYIEHTPSGDNVLKSNSMGTMAIVKNSNASYTAKITGKATYNGAGNYSFILLATDNGEPGAGFDTLGLNTNDPSGHAVPNLTFTSVTIKGGNIQVPHS